MKKCLRYAALAWLGATTVQAAETPNASLFFAPKDIQQIEALAAKSPLASTDKGDVHLGAVFYYGEQDWVLWLQGERWTPDTEHTGLRVIEVKPDEVRLSLAPALGLPGREVVLRPYQTYQLSTGSVVEGAMAAAPIVSR